MKDYAMDGALSEIYELAAKLYITHFQIGHCH